MRYLHTMVRVSDLDASLDFYCNKLGLVEVRRLENEKGRFTLVFLATPDDAKRIRAEASTELAGESPVIELTYNWDEKDYAGGRNFGHLAYRVDDIYGVCQKLMDGGVTINRAGTLVLVASKGDDAIHVFTLSGKHLTPAGKVDLGKGAAPADVVFAPDGRKAYAVATGANRIMELGIDGTHVMRSGRDVATGINPYGATITPDGNWLLNTNLGGALDRKTSGTLTMIDLKSGRLTLNLEVGKVPEHVALSPDGRHAALVLANDASTVKSDPKYDGLVGIIRIYAVGPGTLTPVAQADSCHWAQGLAWSDDGSLVLQQCAAERAIQLFRFDGSSLKRDDSATLTFVSRPGSLSTQHSR